MCKEVSDFCCQIRIGKRTFTLNVSDFPNADFINITHTHTHIHTHTHTHTQFLPIVGLLRQTKDSGIKTAIGKIMYQLCPVFPFVIKKITLCESEK